MNSQHSHRFSRLALLGFIAASFALNSSAQTVTSIVPDGKPHKFEARDHQFFIDGQPTMLIAGEMHFGRTQPEDWDTRIKQAKAMGLNTISFYLFWNQVETKEGKFDFTGMTDVRRVLKLCQENGMWAVLRPGPYCCAEIEYGGIPWWTLKYPDVKVRTTDPQWLDWCRKYLAQVYKQVGDLEVSKGGPLLMVQVENEYGILEPTNNDYMAAMTKIFKEVGFDGLLFTCDPTTHIWSDREPARSGPDVWAQRPCHRPEISAEQGGHRRLSGLFAGGLHGMVQRLGRADCHEEFHHPANHRLGDVSAGPQLFVQPLRFLWRVELRLRQRLRVFFARADELRLQRAGG